MKYLLVLVVILIAVQVWRSNRKPGADDQPAQRKPPPEPKQLEMVRCAVCGLHLPKTDAVNTSAASYCSNEHRLQAEH